MKLNQKQKDLASKIYTELELSGDIAVFQEAVCKIFPKFKDEFKLMCRLKRKYENLFVDLGMEVWDEEM